MIEIQAVALAAISAAGYSFTFYIKKRTKDDPDTFDPYKLAATIIMGIAVGISMELAGVDFGQADISSQIATYAGTVALLETVLKSVYRQFLSGYIES